MAKFYVVGLTQEEVAKHALSRLTDIIREDFFETSQAAVRREILNPKQAWMVIGFENPLTSPRFEDKFKKYFCVLYLNQAAKDVLEANNAGLKVIEEVDTVPKNAGILISMPHFYPE